MWRRMCRCLRYPVFQVGSLEHCTENARIWRHVSSTTSWTIFREPFSAQIWPNSTIPESAYSRITRNDSKLHILGRVASIICERDHRRRCNRCSSRNHRAPNMTPTAYGWRKTIWKSWYERSCRDYRNPSRIRSPIKRRWKKTSSPNRPTQIKWIWRIIVTKYVLYTIYKVIQYRPKATQPNNASRIRITAICCETH